MSIRKCIYTGKEADSKDNVVPKKELGEELHNWTNKAPVSREYKEDKQDRMPTELEYELNKLFYKLEMAKMDVLYYSKKIEEAQRELRNKFEKKNNVKKQVKKDRQIKQAFKEKAVLDAVEDVEKEIIAKKEGLWK